MICHIKTYLTLQKPYLPRTRALPPIVPPSMLILWCITPETAITATKQHTGYQPKASDMKRS